MKYTQPLINYSAHTCTKNWSVYSPSALRFSRFSLRLIIETQYLQINTDYSLQGSASEEDHCASEFRLSIIESI